MEVAGIVVTTLAVGDPLIRAIRGLRKLYHASDEAPEILDRLEHDGSTVSLYLTYVGDTIAQDPSEYPESFIRWFEDEKKLLQRSTAQIDDYAKKVQQRLQANPLVSGVKYAFDVTEISRVQEQLMRSISAIGNMRGICRQGTFASRTAALRAEKTKRLRAQTASSLAEWEGSCCNVSSSFEDSSGASSSGPAQPYQEVLKKSKPYIRAAMRGFFSLNSSDADSARPSAVQTQQPQASSVSNEEMDTPNRRHFDAPGEIQDTPDDSSQSRTDELPTCPSLPQFLTTSTHSSSSQPPSSSMLQGWSIQDMTLGFSTPLTTQTSVSPDPSKPEPAQHQRYIPLRVEVEGLGQSTTEMDRLGENGDLYAQVTATILTLRDGILASRGISIVESSVTSKDQGIVPYKTVDASEPGSTMRLNPGYLAGAVQDLDSGFFSRLEIFAEFVLNEAKDEEHAAASLVLESQDRSDTRRKGRSSADHFPTVQTVLNTYQLTTTENRSHQVPNTWSNHKSSSWSLRWVANNFMTFDLELSAYFVLSDGFLWWSDKQLMARGGSSDVYKVRPSEQHRSWFRRPGPFALKVLKPGHERTFERELEAHKRLAPASHPHLIELLMAYEQENRFHLLFPWADGTLTTLFQAPPSKPTPEVAQWVARQGAGLAEGLQRLHSTSPLPEGRKGRTSGYSLGFTIGRHGDIKPENILVFHRTPQDLGRLVITDFGLARFDTDVADENSVMSKRSRGGTPAYAPPDALPSSSYDLWSLGCVLHEILFWTMGGHTAISEYYSERFSSDQGRGYVFLLVDGLDEVIHLHPTLSSPRSKVKALTSKRLQRLDIEFMNSGDLEAFLDKYCAIVERCLDIHPTNRPSAREVSKTLLEAGEDIYAAASIRPSRITDGLWLSGADNPDSQTGHSFNTAMASSDPTSAGKRNHLCHYPGCNKQFPRQADLRRHHRNVHLNKNEETTYLCDYNCDRHTTPFSRKDHFRDHLRDYHKEDLPRRGNGAGDEEWWTSRALHDGWWRCSRCLVRADQAAQGFDCPDCGNACEGERQRHRLGRLGLGLQVEEVETETQDGTDSVQVI